MREFDLYLPARRQDGPPIDPEVIDGVKQALTEAFGGYTHLKSRSEGAWRVAGVTFRDEITIMRVLDDGAARFDWANFKRDLEHRLDQEQILIVRREVEVV